MSKLLIHDPAGLDHLRTALGGHIRDLHGCHLADGSFVAAIEPAPSFFAEVATQKGVTVFPPPWKPAALSPEHVGVLTYAGVTAEKTMYEALDQLHSFHGFPPFRPETF